MDDEIVLSKNRIEALTDGIFAVVMIIIDGIFGYQRATNIIAFYCC
jgi:hypothetical protein